MQQIKVIHLQGDACAIDRVFTNLDAGILAKHLHQAYAEAGVEVLAINKVEEVEIGLIQ